MRWKPRTSFPTRRTPTSSRCVSWQILCALPPLELPYASKRRVRRGTAAVGLPSLRLCLIAVAYVHGVKDHAGRFHSSAPWLHKLTWLTLPQVSASSSVKKVAGKLAHSAREGDPPAVLAIGADSLNQAIKARGVCRHNAVHTVSQAMVAGDVFQDHL